MHITKSKTTMVFTMDLSHFKSCFFEEVVHLAKPMSRSEGTTCAQPMSKMLVLLKNEGGAFLQSVFKMKEEGVHLQPVFQE